MFDEDAAKTNKPPTNLPLEPADMFAGVEKELPVPPKIPDALSSGLLKKKETVAPAVSVPPPIADIPMAKESNVKKIVLIILLGLLALGGVGFGVWYFVLSKPITTTVKTDIMEQTEKPVVDVEPPLNEVTPPTNNTAAETQLLPVVDTDQDGLDDERERQVGTDPKDPDSDTDGLSDGDEVLIWKTNPLSPDTDGDGYLDGAEIKNGYSPTGPGKLFPIGGTSATTTSPPAGTTVTP